MQEQFNRRYWIYFSKYALYKFILYATILEYLTAFWVFFETSGRQEFVQEFVDYSLVLLPLCILVGLFTSWGTLSLTHEDDNRDDCRDMAEQALLVNPITMPFIICVLIFAFVVGVILFFSECYLSIKARLSTNPPEINSA